jgi:ubiquinone/menaquinone biosynthesis C-methylase UbiE
MDDWRSYDSVAETYARIHAPRLAEPARDLVAITGVSGGQRVLDVGTGTGVAATAAAAAGGHVVGIDEAQGMLVQARAADGGLRLAAAGVIDLPFRNGTFDTVLANFVIAHFTKYQTALHDMLRVLRPGGRLGVTAWSDGQDDLTRTWLELVETVVPREVLQPAMDERLPWRDRFRDRAALEETLMAAGVRQVRTEVRTYRFRYALDEYVEGLGTWATGRFVRSMLGESGWNAFLERARVAFAERFADPLNDRRDVLFATGVKP